MIQSHGYVRVAAISPELNVADVTFNTKIILQSIQQASNEKCQLLVFPELCITGYTCADLFYQELLLEKALEGLLEIAQATYDQKVVVVLGLPLKVQGKLYNVAACLAAGKILGIVPKKHLPNTSEFYEKRWFCPGKDTVKNIFLRNCDYSVPFGMDLLFAAENMPDFIIGLEICEDLWAVNPPSGNMAVNGATIICNPSASNEYLGKVSFRKSLIKSQSSRCIAAYIYASCGANESTTDVVFSGHSLIAESGTILKESERFQFTTTITIADIDVHKLTCERLKNSTFFTTQTEEKWRTVPFVLPPINDSNLLRPLPKRPFVPENDTEHTCQEIFSLQTVALMKRIKHVGIKKVVLGISGGLDSTLAFLVCLKAFDMLKLSRTGIIAITMPGMGTTDRTKNNAQNLAELAGTTFKNISIKKACLQHFKDIGHSPNLHDITYENTQARERTQVLMDVANKEGAFVIGTGDLSELALGWCTYNADHMSMYSVNCGVPKTLIQHIIAATAKIFDEKTGQILKDICDTPISPELLPPTASGDIQQITENKVGPYILHDFFLYYHLHFQFSPPKILFLAEKTFVGTFAKKEIVKWLRVFYKRFFTQQYKRSCLPDGPKVISLSLSPRGDWRMPSDASYNLWLESLEKNNPETKKC